MKMSEKMVVGLVVLVCLVVVVSGCTSTDNKSSSNNSVSNNSTSNASGASGVNIVVSYPGSWAVDVSGSFGYRALSGTGDKTTDMGNISGSVVAAARKTEGGTGTLIVSITKDGKTLGTASTNAPYGGATAVTTV